MLEPPIIAHPSPEIKGILEFLEETITIINENERKEIVGENLVFYNQLLTLLKNLNSDVNQRKNKNVIMDRLKNFVALAGNNRVRLLFGDALASYEKSNASAQVIAPPISAQVSASAATPIVPLTRESIPAEEIPPPPAEEIPPPPPLPTEEDLIAKIDNFGVTFDKQKVGDGGTAKVSDLLGKKGTEQLYKGVKENNPKTAREKFIRALVKALNDPHKQNKSDDRNPLNRTTNINDLLGPEGEKLYEAAKKEEAASQAYRNAVFLNSTTKHGKDQWDKPMVLWVGGPSASGKSYGSAQVIAKMDKEVMEKAPGEAGKGKGNYVVAIDGGVERETSQMRNLLLQVALTQGYSGVGNLAKFDKKDKLKGKVQKAALETGNLSLVIPATFTNPIGPFNMMRKFNKLHKKGKIVHAFSMVTPEKSSNSLEQEQNNQRMKRTVKRMGISRAYRNKSYTGVIDPNDGKAAGCESKVYEEEHYEKGKEASEIAKRFFEHNNPNPICFDIEGDLMYVKKDPDGNWVECLEDDEDLNIKRLNRRDFKTWQAYDKFTPASDKMNFEAWLEKSEPSPIKISKPERSVPFLFSNESYEIMLSMKFKSVKQVKEALKIPPFDYIVLKLEKGQPLTVMESKVIVKLNTELNRLRTSGDKTDYITLSEQNKRDIQNLTNLQQSKTYKFLSEIIKSQPNNKKAINRLEALYGQAQSLSTVRENWDDEENLRISNDIQESIQAESLFDLGSVYFRLTEKSQKDKYSEAMSELHEAHRDKPFTSKIAVVHFLKEKIAKSPDKAEPYKIMLNELMPPQPEKVVKSKPVDADVPPPPPPPEIDVTPVVRAGNPSDLQEKPDIPPPPPSEEDGAPVISIAPHLDVPSRPPSKGPDSDVLPPPLPPSPESEAIPVVRVEAPSALQEKPEIPPPPPEQQKPTAKTGAASFAQNLAENAIELGRLSSASSLPQEKVEEEAPDKQQSSNPLVISKPTRKEAPLKTDQLKAYDVNFKDNIFNTLAELIKRRSEVEISKMAGLQQTTHFTHQLVSILPVIEFAIRGASADSTNSKQVATLNAVKDLFESLLALAKSKSRFSEDHYRVRMKEIKDSLSGAGVDEDTIDKLTDAIDHVVKPQLFKGRSAYHTAGTGSTEFDPKKPINLTSYKKRVKVEHKEDGKVLRVQFSYNANTLSRTGAKGKIWSAFHDEAADFQRQMEEFVTVAINEYGKGSDKNPLKISYSNSNNPNPAAALGILMEYKKRAIAEGREFHAIDHNGTSIKITSEPDLTDQEKAYFMHFAQEKNVVKGVLGGLGFSPPAGYGVFYDALKEIGVDKNNIPKDDMEEAMQQSLDNMVKAHNDNRTKVVDSVAKELEQRPVEKVRSRLRSSSS